MSRLKIVKKALGSTPVVGYFYRGAVRTYYYLNWLRLCWIGRRYLTRSSGQKFDPSNPLKIDGLHITELHPTPRDNRFQYNPTIRLEENGLRIYWRISNWGDNPEVYNCG